MDTKHDNEASHGRHAATNPDQTERMDTVGEGYTSFTSAAPAYEGAGRTYAAAAKGHKRKHPAKVIAIMLLVIVVIVVAAYAAVALYFQDRFYPNTVIGDVDVSLKTTDEAADALAAAIDDYSISIEGQGLELKLSAEEASLDVDEEGIVADVAATQDSWQWAFEIAGDHDGSQYLVTESTGTGLADAITAAVDSFNETATKPTDATVVYDEDAGVFVVQEEAVGTQLDAEGIIALAEEALLDLETSVEVTEECLSQPSVLSTDEAVQTAADEANAVVTTSLSFTLADDEVATLDGSQLVEWVSIGDDLSVSLDTESLTGWVEDLADDWNTVGTTRTYTRPDGKEITVSGGDYGWEIDVDSLVSTVQENVTSGTATTIAVPCTSEGQVYTAAGEKDWGSRYCDIDISEQHVYFYDEDGELIWESDCVTGTPGGDRETPTGVYDLNWKSSPQTLISYNDDGTIDYESDVEYWMAFVGSSVGLHDASWQSAFGGTRYKDGYGSHGCVNLPTDAAAELYEIIQTGDVVVVHD